MLTWAKELYLSESVTRIEKFQKKLEKGKITEDYYLITLGMQEGNLMEILPAGQLRQELLRELCPPIIGVAGSKKEALDLTVEIIDTCYRETGGFEIRPFIENR